MGLSEKLVLDIDERSGGRTRKLTFQRTVGLAAVAAVTDWSAVIVAHGIHIVGN